MRSKLVQTIQNNLRNYYLELKVNEYFRFDFNVIMTSDNITY